VKVINEWYPQIIIDGECIGGFTELTELHMDDRLDHLMKT